LVTRGIDKSRIVVVSNTEDETTFRFKPRDADPTIVNNYKRHWMVSYIGSIAPHRGLDTLLMAIAYARKQIPKLMLTVVGVQKKDQVLIDRWVRKLSIREHVDVVHWQPFDKVYAYIIASQVGIIPHNNFEHTQTTIPHKLFQYMLSARPVLVSSCRPLKRVIMETRAGRIFEANNHKDLARHLIHMNQNKPETRQLGLNGRQAALGQYAWRNDARRLVDMYAELEGMRP
jgi:glycosyltransferase involved in cell wall biosynthesis